MRCTMPATMSLGDRNFSAPYAHGTTIVDGNILLQHMAVIGHFYQTFRISHAKFARLARAKQILWQGPLGASPFPHGGFRAWVWCPAFGRAGHISKGPRPCANFSRMPGSSPAVCPFKGTGMLLSQHRALRFTAHSPALGVMTGGWLSPFSSHSFQVCPGQSHDQ